MTRAAGAILLVCVALCADAQADSIVFDHRGEDSSVVLVPSPGSHASAGFRRQLLDHDAPPGLDASSEEAVAKACGIEGAAGGGAGETKFIAGGLALALGSIVHLAVTGISDEIRKQMLSYTTAYQAQTDGAFWASARGDEHAQLLLPATPAYSCFRFVKTLHGAPAVDFIGQFDFTPNADAMRVRPLRLYFGRSSLAKPASDLVVSLALDISAVWQQNNESRSALIVAAPILTRHIVMPASGAPHVAYFLKADEWPQESRRWYSVPPVSVDWSGKIQMPPPATLSVSVSEVGAPPAFLQFLATHFSVDDGGIGASFARAAALGEGH